MPLSKAEEFWKNYDEDRDPTEVGGGVISRGEILTGYQVFPEDGRPTFFRADVGDEAGRKTALAEAREIGNRPQWGVMIRADKDASYKMADDGTYALVTWKENREEFCAKFTDGFKEVFVPAFQALGVTTPWQGYFRLGWKPDPFATKKGEAGKTETYNDEPRFPQIMFPLELYADAAAAQAAVEGVTSEGKVIPKEWEDDEAGWKDEVIAIKEQVKEQAGKLKGKKRKNAVENAIAKYLAAEYGDGDDESGVSGLGATVAEVLDWLSL